MASQQLGESKFSLEKPSSLVPDYTHGRERDQALSPCGPIVPSDVSDYEMTFVFTLLIDTSTVLSNGRSMA